MSAVGTYGFWMDGLSEKMRAGNMNQEGMGSYRVVRLSRWYRPLPPITPISTAGRCVGINIERHAQGMVGPPFSDVIGIFCVLAVFLDGVVGDHAQLVRKTHLVYPKEYR